MSWDDSKLYSTLKIIDTSPHILHNCHASFLFIPLQSQNLDDAYAGMKRSSISTLALCLEVDLQNVNEIKLQTNRLFQWISRYDPTLGHACIS